jgi:alkylation response protein AidB-like acyl-CoA dehydrogenase
MDLDFSEEQEVLRDMVRSFCNEFSPVEAVRAAEDDPTGYPAELWKQMGELGLLGVLIEEEHGGSGQGLLDAVIVHEELGRALAPSPAFVSSVVCAKLLQKAGSDAQRKAWLPGIASGEAILSPAWLEPQRGFGAKGVQLAAVKDGDAFVLTGTKRHVAFASSATRLVVLARTGEGEDEIGLFLVDPNQAGISMKQMKSLSSDCQYDVAFDGVRVAASDLVGTATDGFATWDAVMLEAIIVLAATAVGGCEKAHEITTQYAKDRKQFDKPLGAFQAISHYLADGITAIDGAKVLVYEAAWACDEGRDIRRLAPMAKLFACDTYRDVTATCEQIWGGVGFTIEYDIQLYFRRAKQLQLTWWDARTLEERIAVEVLDR